MIKLLLELHLNLIFIGKKHFHKNPLLLRMYADFEADNEKNDFGVGNTITNFHKQNPVLNGYEIVSELVNV